MKRYVLLGFAIACSVLASCGNGEQKDTDTTQAPPPAAAPAGPENQALVDSAKLVVDEANKWVEKGVRNKATNEQVNTALRPIMEKYHAITQRLSPADTMIINQYRVDGVNKLINLQIQLDSQQK